MADLFSNRADAGRALGTHLVGLRASGRLVVDHDPIVVGLPRGGVPVAREVARALGVPLDVIIVRKLGIPYDPEVAMGAIGEDGVRIVDDEIVRRAGVSAQQLADVEAAERVELERRSTSLRRGRSPAPLRDRDVVIVDDGIATGSTAKAACRVARAHGARRVVLAVPVAAPDWLGRMGDAADQYVVLVVPDRFRGVGGAYRDFSQTSDDDVTACLFE